MERAGVPSSSSMSFVSSSPPILIAPAESMMLYNGFLAFSVVAHVGKVMGVLLWLATFPPIALLLDSVMPPVIAVFSLRASCLFMLASSLALA